MLLDIDTYKKNHRTFVRLTLRMTLPVIMLAGKEADPGGTAIPGQPVTESEQAPDLYPLSKIRLISKGAHGSRIRY